MARFTRFMQSLVSGRRMNVIDGTLQLPAHAIYTRWQWADRLSVVEFDITVHEDPGTSVGEYLSPFNGSIDGTQIYFGLQTDVHRPASDQPGAAHTSRIGKGAIFSTWGSFEAKDVRWADDGFIERGTHEGQFLGVRRPFVWGLSSYRMRLSRGDVDLTDVPSDWFDLSIQPIDPLSSSAASGTRPAPSGDAFWIGSLRFARQDPAIPATLSAHGIAFLEVYRGALTFGEITPWWCDLQGFGDGRRPVSARAEYPAFPHGQNVPNADTWYEPERDRVHLRFGGVYERTHEPAQLWDDTAAGS